MSVDVDPDGPDTGLPVMVGAGLWFVLIIALAVALAGCATGGSGFLGLGGAADSAKGGASSFSDPIRTALAPVYLVGTLSMIAGVVLLFVTKLSRGWIPLGLGIGLGILAALLQAYWWVIAIIALMLGAYHLYTIQIGRKKWRENGPTWFSGLDFPWRRSASGSSSADTADPRNVVS